VFELKQIFTQTAGIHQHLRVAILPNRFAGVLARALLWLVMLAGSVSFVLAAELVSLTDHERDYLDKHGVVTMCVDPDWAPFEIINAAGLHEGIAADLIELVANRLGVEIVLYTTQTWEESLLASQSGQCDLMSFLNQTPDRQEWLIFTEPIFFDNNVIISRATFPDIPSPSVLRDQTIALPLGTMVAERIGREFPDVHVIPTSSEAEAVDLVSRGVVDLTVRSLVVAAYTIKQEGLFNLKVAARMPGYENELRIGVLKDKPVLREILNKGVATITDQDRNIISNRHAGINVVEQVSYRIIWEILFVSLLVVSGLLYLYLHQRKLNWQSNRLSEQRLADERRARQEQRRLVAMLSHEIKTPLAMIDGAAQALKALTDQGSPDIAKRLDRIRRATARLVGMSDQLLMKDRLEDEMLCVHPHEFAFDDLVMQVIDELSATARVTCTIEGQTQVFGDPVLLKVLLQNLISNALKYSQAPIEVDLLGGAERLSLRVRDQGQGIPEDLRARLFDQYVRGSHADDIPGSGLGLYLCARIASLHGGSIALGAPQRGAEFIVDLPLRYVQG
jgi:polar amino acid transport system substrate-binding protein